MVYICKCNYLEIKRVSASTLKLVDICNNLSFEEFCEGFRSFRYHVLVCVVRVFGHVNYNYPSISSMAEDPVDANFVPQNQL